MTARNRGTNKTRKNRKDHGEVIFRAAKLSPEAPEARDEGPRLIPLANILLPVLPDHSRYLAMADEALRKPRSTRKTRQ
jgi:hypothetical protein